LKRSTHLYLLGFAEPAAADFAMSLDARTPDGPFATITLTNGSAALVKRITVTTCTVCARPPIARCRPQCGPL